MQNLLNKELKLDCLELMKLIPDDSVTACFFDPQYRGGLDTINYGNETMRQVERSKLPSMSDEFIRSMLVEIERVLKPTGHLFLWSDSFTVASGLSSRWVGEVCSKSALVDLIVWNKMTFGMGYRSRRTCEYITVVQKLPKRVKDVWLDHSIPDIWPEKVSKKIHTHQKPYKLISRLVSSVTREHDVVLDPCAGSFIVAEICKELNRNFIATDIVYGQTTTI
jgi:site-specific DNA-methyltransferase (adenine-specific)